MGPTVVEQRTPPSSETVSSKEAFSRSLSPLEEINFPTREITDQDNWKLRYVKRFLQRGKDVHVTTDGQRVRIESKPKDGSFTLVEVGDSNNLFLLGGKLAEKFGSPSLRLLPHKKGSLDKSDLYQLDETRLSETAKEGIIKGQHKIVFVTDQAYLLNPETPEVVSLKKLARELTGEERDLVYGFKLGFGLAINMDYNDMGDKIGVVSSTIVPADVMDLLSILHETGHHIAHFSEEERQFITSPKIYTDQERFIHMNTKSERGAWAAAFKLMKLLREHGFLKVTNQKALELSDWALRTYETSSGGTEADRGKTSTHFSKEARKITRAKNPLSRLRGRARFFLQNLWDFMMIGSRPE